MKLIGYLPEFPTQTIRAPLQDSTPWRIRSKLRMASEQETSINSRKNSAVLAIQLSFVCSMARRSFGTTTKQLRPFESCLV